MAANNDGGRRARTARSAFLFAGLIAGALVLLNLFSSREYRQLDMTSYKIYSLSQPSKDLVSHLDEKMMVTLYQSANLPEQTFGSFTQYLADLLDEYQAASRGNLEWRKVDPIKDESVQSEAKDAEFITQVPEKDQIQTLKGYLGAKIVYKGKTEWFKVADQRTGSLEINPANLEYNLTTTMRKLVETHKPKLGLLTGHGELGQDQGGMSILWKQPDLSDNYETTTVDLKGGSQAVPADVDVLLVAGPKQKLTDREVYQIDQFAMTGKPVLFFLDGIKSESPRTSGDFGMVDTVPQIGSPNDVLDPNGALAQALKAYGFKVDQDVVLDQRPTYGPAEVPVRGNQDITVSPAFAVEKIAANGSDDFADGVPAAVFPIAASVERVGPLGDGNQPPGSSLTLVAETTDQAVKAKMDPFFMFSKDPQTGMVIPPYDAKTKGTYTLGWIYRGPLSSAWKGKPSPISASSNSSTLDPNEKQSTKMGTIAVLGTSAFLSDQYIQFMGLPMAKPFYSGNVLTFLDLVDWSVKDNSLTALRAKGNITWPLDVKQDSKAPLYAKVANLAGLPLLVIFIGLARTSTRRRRRARLNG